MYGERIRKLRKKHNMTLKELAKELKIPPNTLGNYEREERKPGFDLLISITEYFGVSLDYLVGTVHQRTFTEHPIVSDAKNLAQELIEEDKNVDHLVKNIYKRMYLLTSRHLNKEDLKGLQSLNVIINFLFDTKNGYFLRDMNNPGTQSKILMEYNRRKLKLDETLLEFLNNSLERKDPTYQWDFERQNNDLNSDKKEDF